MILTKKIIWQITIAQAIAYYFSAVATNLALSYLGIFDYRFTKVLVFTLISAGAIIMILKIFNSFEVFKEEKNVKASKL